MKTQYRVHAEGYGIKTEDLYFSSKNKAIEYMKKWFDFYTRMEASLFTCIKEVEDDSEWVETKYSICNI